MRRIATLIGLIVFGASVAASAQVVTRDTLRQYFSSHDLYSQGFRAGYAAGVADTSSTAYGNPGLINANVQRCIQTQPYPTLLQIAGSAIQQWVLRNDPRAIPAYQVINAYNSCFYGPDQDRKDNR